MHDLIVISDLHLGRGKNPETGRFHALETFFYDDDLRRFCEYLCRDAAARATPFKLILNGDVFDLLRIDGDDEKRFGPKVTPAGAAQLVAAILGGHPGVVDGLAAVLEAGHEVVFLPGNHDVELQWEPVQAEIRSAVLARLRERAGDDAAAAGTSRLRFEPWFYHEPGRVWIEHGCQYDPEGSFRYLLRGALDRLPEVAPETDLDLPLGNFFQRYLYNAFGPITFIVPSSDANLRYFKWLVLRRPRLLARAVASHGPFAWQFLRRLARAGAHRRGELRRVHETELELLAVKSGLGRKLHEIDDVKEVRGDVVQAVNRVGRQVVRMAVGSTALGIVGAALWFAGFHAISQLGAGFGLKALLFVALNFLMLAFAAGGLMYWLLRGPPAAATRTLPRAARRIAEVVGVPLVTFGHTHDEAIVRLRQPSADRAWYFNTGTWIAVFMRDVLVPRERVQLTFLRVRGHEGELLHWSPGRGEPLPVILLDEGRLEVPTSS